MFKLLVTIASFLISTELAYADLLRTGTIRWAVMASTQELENAVGIAEAYTSRFNEVQVVESSNGWFAVIGGPVSITKGAKAAREELWRAGGFPRDMFLSNGQNFVRTVWTPQKTSNIPTWNYNGVLPLSIKAIGLDIQVSTRIEGDLHFPVITLKQGEKILAQEAMKSAEFTSDRVNAKVEIAWLDRTSKYPQIVFSSYWDGAHCCTVTKILTENSGSWKSIQTDNLDGDGYQLQDIDGNGDVELISSDNSFLYKFASYAESWAPLIISKFNGNKLVDMRWNPMFQRYYKRQIYKWEFLAKIEPSLWHKNGFLAGWTALKSVLNEPEQGWATTIAKYDRTNDWPLTVCDEAVSNGGVCPEEATRQVSFPDALRDHLVKNGYDASTTQSAPLPPPPSVTAAVAPNDPQPKATPKAAQETSSGTGFFVSDKGHVITNHHVIKGCAAIDIRRPNSTPQQAALVADDPTNDLALLRVDSDTGSHASLRVETRLGEAVAVFGYPLSSVLASGGNFTLGNVTALAGLRNDTRFIQISAPVQPGNSGGPLLDAFGNVIGVVTSKLDALFALAAIGDIPQNVNFALRGSSLYAFLLTYGITPTTASTTTKLEAPDLADRAASFSVAITCQ